jgi:hypothetical protein
MSDIGMVSEIRTDFDCEVVGLPSEMWAECKVQIEDSDDFHFEIIAEKNPVIHLIIGDVQWKGTIKGLKDLLQSQK